MAKSWPSWEAKIWVRHRTVIGIVVAETMGLPLSAVNVKIGDSNYPPSGPSGGSTTVGGVSSSTRRASVHALEQLERGGGAFTRYDGGSDRSRRRPSRCEGRFRQAQLEGRLPQAGGQLDFRNRQTAHAGRRQAGRQRSGRCSDGRRFGRHRNRDRQHETRWSRCRTVV